MGRSSETSVRLSDSRADALVMGSESTARLGESRADELVMERSSETTVRKVRAELMRSLREGQVKPLCGSVRAELMLSQHCHYQMLKQEKIKITEKNTNEVCSCTHRANRDE
jgi:hypothetical protein